MNNVFDTINIKLNEKIYIEIWSNNLVEKCYEHWMYSIVERKIELLGNSLVVLVMSYSPNGC